MALEMREAEDFLRRGARALTAAGYRVAGTDLAAAVTAEAVFPETASDGKPEAARPKLVVRVAGKPVTAEEIRFLLEQGSTLVFFRERWIEVDRNILREALRALERQNGKKEVSSLAFALGIGHVGRLEVTSEAAGPWTSVVASLRAVAEKARDAKGAGVRVKGLAGKLRGYQARGVAWMRQVTDAGFGALLADDMGLGKTIQTIAWLLASRATAKEAPPPVLIVAPLTLLANWRRELATFAPQLAVYVHQGDNRHLASGFGRAARAADVVLTSYNLLVREHPLFAEVAWDALVLDEAQAIKNPDTQVAKAVRALSPPRRVALTGTPIENTVADVWSLEEFLNPGLLGDRKSFDERFVKPLAADALAGAGRRLRRALEPFVLRRLKTEPAIAAEIGEKREIREWCVLSGAQRADYETILADYRAGARRQGDVFALLTRLKLVCDGMRGGGEDLAPDCGKFQRLVELLRQIFAAGESVLVFTQYARVGKRLQEALAAVFGGRFPFLHGALAASERERQVADFTASTKPSAFILSLKAGGFGLNLTKATHVVHYDRWWNPAVENQATDRAHRIGQDRTVFVHAFVTAGTLEEHIDDILARKETLEGILRDRASVDRLVNLERET